VNNFKLALTTVLLKVREDVNLTTHGAAVRSLKFLRTLSRHWLATISWHAVLTCRCVRVWCIW